MPDPAPMDGMRIVIGRFLEGLRSAPSATRFLESWCAARGIGAPPIVSRRRAPLPDPPPPPPLLGVAPRHRSVTLYRGSVALSDCDVWWAEGRLAPAMTTALAETEQPFGTVVAPLAPRRRILAHRPAAPPHALEVRAVLEAGGEPFALVREFYRAALFTADH